MRALLAVLTVWIGWTSALASGPADRLDRLCAEHPGRIDKLFRSLNLDYPGLEEVRAQWERGDRVGACRALLDYYKSSDSGKWLRQRKTNAGDETIVAANAALNGTFTFNGATGTVPSDAQGRFDWNYTSDNDFQWTMFLNRHLYLLEVMDAYLKTRESAYTDWISRKLGEWILACEYPGKGFAYTRNPKEQGQFYWTLLEAGGRASVWAAVFYGLYEQLTPEVRILMLSSVPEHLHCIRHYHSSGGNHLLIEVRGLTVMAGAFPEFADSSVFLDYAAQTMEKAMLDQVYPDGVQNELTVHYHAVSLRAFNDFAHVFRQIGRPLPSAYSRRLELMFDYLAYVQRPSGHGPLNNDSDYLSVRPTLRLADEDFQRGDWTYICTQGAAGEAPERLSVFYSWAGQAVLRSGWDAEAQWAFFDVGPWGAGHKHADKLHLSVTAYGRDLLVDSGRYTYVGYSGGSDFPWRDYFISSISHNVILIDGKGQTPRSRVARAPLTDMFITTPAYDFVRGTYDEGYDGIDDTVRHTRGVLYLRNRFWVVADRVVFQKPHRVQALWRYHPDCTVALEGRSATSVDANKANLRILPLGSMDWNVELVRGQKRPHIQGWYSAGYNQKTPNTVVVYTATPKAPQTFVWILSASPKGTPSVPDARITGASDPRVQLTVRTDDNQTVLLTIPMDGPIEAVSVDKL